MHSGDSAFFYGTLMAPSVLARVTGHDVNRLTFRAAILPGHRRHRVRDVDYPALVPADNIIPPASSSSSSSSHFPSSPAAAGNDNTQSTPSSVRGTWVSGLDVTDFWRLDIFEGSEYARRDVKVRLLPQQGDLLAQKNGAEGEAAAAAAAAPLLDQLSEVQTQTYIWTAPRDLLDPEEWDFEEFKREKLWRWAGDAPAEVDQDPGFDDIKRAVAEASEASQTSSSSAVADPTRGRSAAGGAFEEAVKYQQHESHFD